MDSFIKCTFLFFYFFYFPLFAQSPQKSLTAIRTEQAPKIDGNPNDEIWKSADTATHFIMFDPIDGQPASSEYDTEVKIVYDNAAIYILAIMKDPNPSSIAKEFGLRDQLGEADYFQVIINPFFSKGNNYVFGVTASGAQLDGILREKTDYSWNAVWKSAVKITNKGWVVEMEIPYSALRFQNEEVQNWGIDFIREIKNKRETYSWTYIDKKKTGDWVQFLGTLKDIRDIKPPVRLSLYPYASTNISKYKGKTITDYGFGMDLKYGLSENYTLDATLIPDFSDTPYDNLVLNLGPFEQYYPEQRDFFTEGMSLFNKMNLFYSRRIGGTPSGYKKIRLENGEIIEENPETIKLYNAIKISGRNKKGLGIGVLNAVTQATNAIIKNTLTGDIRKVETEPMANYNVFVMDYNFKLTNSIGFINTNVLRSGDGRDANVLGGYFDINTQKNTLNLKGEMARSFIFSDRKKGEYQGNKFSFSSTKSFGAHKIFGAIDLQDTEFNPKDLAYYTHNNFVNYTLGYKFSSLKPSKWYRKNIFYSFINLNYLFDPYQQTLSSLQLRDILIAKNLFVYHISFRYAGEEKDYYQAGIPGRYFLVDSHLGSMGTISTDRRKKISGKFTYSYFKSIGDPQKLWMIGIEPRWRINNRFKFNYAISYRKKSNFKGALRGITKDEKIEINNIYGDDHIYFASREQKEIKNRFGASYYFNIKSALNFNLYHYWTPFTYTKLYNLEENGKLSILNNNFLLEKNYNYWNFDLVYIWEFAPGSQLSLMYRNRIENLGNNAEINFKDNLDDLFKSDKEHRFIMKLTYYIDYNTVKNKYF